MKKFHFFTLALLFVCHSFADAGKIRLQRSSDGKYYAPALSTNHVYVGRRDCPTRIRTAAFSSATAKISILVTDIENQPINSATVEFYFGKAQLNWSWDYKAPKAKTRLTDKNGMANASGESCETVGFHVSKDGYYDNGGTYFLRINPTKESVSFWGRWQPWNPILEIQLVKCDLQA